MSSANIETSTHNDDKNIDSESGIPVKEFKKTDGDSTTYDADDYQDLEKPSSLDYLLWCKQRTYKRLKPIQEMFIDKDILKRSINSVRFAVLCNAVNLTILKPNYPIMALPGGHPDSFTSTAPFDFNAATYFLPMMALLGVAISSTIAGRVSDRIGRKPVMMIMLAASGVGSMVKFFTRKSFWGFCIASFFTGLFSSTLPIGMAYASDVNPSKRDSDAEVGIMVGFNMLGASGGGICAILLTQQGLFTPLWIGVALNVISTVTTLYYVIEPRDYKALHGDEFTEVDESEGYNGLPVPTEIDMKACANIIAGAFADNIGSSGLVPLCLSPLMFDKYYTDFINNNLTPIMSQNDYKWISVMVSLMVIPSTVITPALFSKIGAAGSCVFGNTVTGLVTIILLQIGHVAPATIGWYAGFILILYLSFPFTVISQLTTGPMLDVITPPDKRGMVQGLNITVMNFGMAVTPWILGIVADSAGTPTAIWICVGVSFLAALINAPLMLRPGMGPTPKPIPEELRPLDFEDADIVEKAIQGEWIPLSVLSKIKQKRRLEGKRLPLLHAKKYAQEKEEGKIVNIRMHAEEDYRYLHHLTIEWLKAWNNAEECTMEKKQALCDSFNVSRQADKKEIEEVNSEIGQWAVDYLMDNGYKPYYNTMLLKQMLMTTFPKISDNEDYTPENAEGIVLRFERLMYNYVKVEEEKKRNGWWTSVMQGNASAVANISAR